jgi:hypothetical protein
LQQFVIVGHDAFCVNALPPLGTKATVVQGLPTLQDIGTLMIGERVKESLRAETGNGTAKRALHSEEHPIYRREPTRRSK